MADKKPTQVDSDNEIIKGVFAENDELLFTMRKLFFGAEITIEEKQLIKNTFQNKAVVDVFQRKLYSKENYGTEIGHVSDFWLGAETQIFGASRDTIHQAVRAKETILESFEKAIALLSNPDGERVDVNKMKMSLEADPLAVGLLVRILYMKAIESALHSVKTIAGLKSETVEETTKRLLKDSSK